MYPEAGRFYAEIAQRGRGVLFVVAFALMGVGVIGWFWRWNGGKYLPAARWIVIGSYYVGSALMALSIGMGK